MGKSGRGLITHCGTVWGTRGCSYLYMIFTADHAYIGETGNLPTSRWGSHLSRADSSFAEKLRRDLEGSAHPDYDGDFVYIGLHCGVIDEEDELKRKYARTAIEEAIHREYILNGNSFGGIKKVLSRPTKRSARITLGFDVDSYAKHAIATLIKEYKKYTKHCSAVAS
jgi:hypothetical protein